MVVVYDIKHPPCFTVRFNSLFPQSVPRLSLVCLYVLHLPLHNPCIFSPNHSCVFINHVHTIYFAVALSVCLVNTGTNLNGVVAAADSLWLLMKVQRLQPRLCRQPLGPSSPESTDFSFHCHANNTNLSVGHHRTTSDN